MLDSQILKNNIEEFNENLKKRDIDVDTSLLIELDENRRKAKFEAEQINGAQNIPLDFINDNLELLDKQTEYHIHCLGGYRSMIFNSILKSRGYHQLIDIEGGIRSIKETEVPTIVR